MELLLIIVAIVEFIIIVVAAFKLTQSKKTVYDGNMVLTETEEKRTFSFEVRTDPETWTKKDHIVLKVTTTPE